MIDERVQLMANDAVADDFYLARWQAPHIAAQVEPGQFVNIEVAAGVAPLLRIPLSVCAADPQAGYIDVLYEDMGPKSQALSRLVPGVQTQCLGPLGRGFPPPAQGAGAILVGGGIGVPPMLYWGAVLRRCGVRVALLVGARHRGKHLPDPLLAPAADTVRRATDDGSLGHAGLVTDLLRDELAEVGPHQVYCCGPHGMMQAVAALCREMDAPCQVSLEEYMACGIGICVGCAVELVGAEDDSDYSRYARICVDGPVFDARRVKWGH